MKPMVVQRVGCGPGGWHRAGRMSVGSEGYPLAPRGGRESWGGAGRKNRAVVPGIWQPLPLDYPGASALFWPLGKLQFRA